MRKNFLRWRSILLLAIFVFSAQSTSAADCIGTIVIAKNSNWKYEASGADLGTAWRAAGYNDGGWPSGNGILGFGESYIATTLPSGPITHYFRQSFTLADPVASIAALTLLVNYDDGFVAYLNGQEVARQALHTGTISYTTFASSHEGGAYESLDLSAHVSKLVAGNNVLAVELHQNAAASSDAVMDLQLSYNTGPSSTATPIAKNANWKYEASGADLGTAWQAASYNDGGWPSGNGILGFGESYIATTLPSGRSTYYFRQTFTLADPVTAIASLTLAANYDDGFVAYLNGQEVTRQALPAGTIAHNTLASSHEGGVYESIDLTAHLNKLVAGSNVLAVEVHQNAVTSSDLVMDMELSYRFANAPASVTRGPYLQMGTPTQIVVRWRTNVATASRVQYGTAAGNLKLTADDPAATTEHEVKLSNLTAGTKYYYSVGTTGGSLASGADYYFVTAPPAGSAKKTRVWVLGDAGTTDFNQEAVRDAYYNFTGATPTDLWVMLGDNAYTSGSDCEYQAAVFEMYPTMLRQSVLWPAFGNHDGLSADSPAQSGPFYDSFTLPKLGEAGGLASGTEAYYSFDFANIHFICLNSEDISRSTTGAMLTWLQQDLAANTKNWTIAFWHHSPYSKGSHDSDAETELIEMRQNALPILENGGCDLVLTGHSHSYERSFLLDGHYGASGTLTSKMILDGGSGRDDGDGAYSKPTLGPASHEGAVYVVAGNAGHISGGALNHPAMFFSLNSLGSVVLDIDNDRADVKFLDQTGTTRDYFTLRKGGPPAAPSNLKAAAINSGQINLLWTDNSSNEDGFKLERSLNPTSGFAQFTTVGAGVTSFNNTGLSPNTQYYYRVRAYNTGGNSSYSNTAGALTSPNPPAAPTGLMATAAGNTQINLTWTDASANEIGFRIKRSATGLAGSFVQIDSVGAGITSYSNTGLTALTTYYYQVCAYNGGGQNASSPAKATTFDNPPAAPSALIATPVSNTQINLLWTDNSSNEDGFKLERSLNPTSGFAQFTTVGAGVTSFNNTGLSPNTQYYYRVRAYNTGGNSSYSNTAGALTSPNPPAAPTGLMATAAGNTQINLTWTDSSANEIGFRIKRSATGLAGSFVQIDSVGAGITSYSNTGLTALTTYYYQVCAYNGGGQNASSPAKATTFDNPPAAPSALIATPVSNTQINLLWTDNSSNEDGFKLERSLNPTSGFAQFTTVGAGVTSFNNTGLSPNTQYYYRVRAYNTGGNSSYSNTAGALTSPNPPAAPTGLMATAAGNTQINLTWTDASANEIGFRIKRSATGLAGSFVQIDSVGAGITSYSNTGLTALTTYYYQVCAYNGGGQNASSPAKATTFVNPPAAPSNLALNKPATASSSSRSYAPGNAVDGSTNTYWLNGLVMVNSTTAMWWRVDLGASLSIGRVVIKWRNSNYATNYQIQVSSNGISYSTVYTDNAGNGGTDEVVFASTAARYVRVYMTRNNFLTEQLNEVEVYAAAGAALRKFTDGAIAAAAIPEEITLAPNYPNPFPANGTFGNPATTLAYSLPQGVNVTLHVVNLNGQIVATLANGYHARGVYQVTFDATNLPSGLYFSVLKAPQSGVTQVQRMLLAK